MPADAKTARISKAKLRAYLRGIPGCFEKVGFETPPESGAGLMLKQQGDNWLVWHVDNGELTNLVLFTDIQDAVDFILVELPEFESCISEVSPYQAIVYKSK